MSDQDKTLDIEVRFVIPKDLIENPDGSEIMMSDDELGSDFVSFLNDHFSGEVSVGMQIHLVRVSEGLLI